MATYVSTTMIRLFPNMLEAWYDLSSLSIGKIKQVVLHWLFLLVFVNLFLYNVFCSWD
jgi:hypothetical protein